MESAEKVQGIGSQNYLKRLVKHDNDTRAIANEVAAVSWSIENFSASPLHVL